MTPSLNRPAAPAKQNLQFRDPDDPRLLYKISQRARRISLRVNSSDREVIITVPGKRAMTKARAFALKQKDWIDVQLEALPRPEPFIPGQTITLFGEPFTLVRPEGRGRPVIDREAKEIRVAAPDEAFAGRVRRLLIREARSALEDASHKYAAMLGKEVAKISVRDTSSRWGSCITRAGKGHISYSWRLIGAPPYVLDYVAAHECAHMIEANHSAAFWAVVDDIFSETKKAKNWLRAHGANLHALGAEY